MEKYKEDEPRGHCALGVEVGMVSLSRLPPPFITSILKLVSVSWQSFPFLNNRTLK